MKTLKSVVASLCLLIATGGQGSEAFRRDINPALRYYQAFILAPELSQTDRDYLFKQEWLGEKLPARFGELVSRYDKEFDQVRAAAEANVPCDWGIDMTPGPFTLLPHLARCKGIAQSARLRAMWDLQTDRPEDGVHDLIGALALARNSSRQGVLISLLVQIAMENIVCSAIAENFYHFSPATLQTLVAGLDSVPARGSMGGSGPEEVGSFVDWLGRHIADLQKQNPSNDANVMAGIQELIVALDGPDEQGKAPAEQTLWQRVSQAAGGTSGGVVKLLEDASSHYPKLKQIMNLPTGEYEEQISLFNADVRASKNPFMSLLFAAWDKCRQKELAAIAGLSMVRAGIEYKLHGEAGLRRVTDLDGQSPFKVERFLLNGADRGFKLTSSYQGRGFPEGLIFVEKPGPPFGVTGNKAGEALPKPSAPK